MLIVISLLVNVYSLSLLNNFGELLIHSSDQVSLYLYNYFSGSYLMFSTDSPYITISPEGSMSIVSKISQETTPISQIDKFSTYSTWQSQSTVFIIDYKFSLAFLYSLDILSGIVTKVWAAAFPYNIKQINTWSFNNSMKAIILTESDQNYVYIMDINETNYSNIMELSMWDIKYIGDLRSCDIENIPYIPFIGNFYNQFGAVFNYDFTIPTNPILINFILDYSNSFFPIDIKIKEYYSSSLYIIVLDANYGLYIFYYSDIPSLMSRINLTEYGCLNSIQIVENEFYKNLVNTDIITVGTCKGLVTVRLYEGMIMFYKESISKNGDIYPITASFALNNIHFMISNYSDLLVLQDEAFTRNIMYGFTVDINDFQYTKWRIFQGYPEDEYILVISNNLELISYKIIAPIPTVSIKSSTSDYIAFINATNYSNFSLLNYVTVKDLKNLNNVEYANGYYVSNVSYLEIDVLFQGFSQVVQFNIFDYISGSNLSYEVSNVIPSAAFSITPNSFEKLQNINKFALDQNYTSVIISEQYLFLVSSNFVDAFDHTQNELIPIYSLRYSYINQIVEFEGFLLIAFQNSSGFYIDLPNLLDKMTLNSTKPCKLLNTDGIFIICSDGFTLLIYTQNGNGFELLIQLNQRNMNYMNIIAIALCSNPSVNYLAILDSDSVFRLVNLNAINRLQTSLEYIITVKLSEAYNIAASEYQIYVLCDSSLIVFSNSGILLRNITLSQGKFFIDNLQDFIYLSQGNELIIIDGMQTLINSYFLIKEFDPLCLYADAGFQNTSSIVAITCFAETKFELIYFLAPCPIFKNSGPCTYPLELQVQITNPYITQKGIFYQPVTFLARNSNSSAEILVNFTYIVYGQAVTQISDTGIHDFDAIEYNLGYQEDLLNVFTGNNMDIDLYINKKLISIEDQDFNPLYITPKMYEKNEFVSEYEFYSITAISNSPYLVAMTQSGLMQIFNITNSENITHILAYNLTQIFSNNAACTFSYYISTLSDIIYMGSSCFIDEMVTYYNREGQKEEYTIKQYMIVVWQIQLETWKILSLNFEYIDYEPSAISIITKSNSVFTIVASPIIDIFLIGPYSNNRVDRFSYSILNNSISVAIRSSIDLYSLGIEQFYAVSINGFYLDSLYLVIVDYWFGVRIIKITEQYSIVKGIPMFDVEDRFISAGVTQSSLIILSKSGKMFTYHMTQSMEIKYYVTRYPFTSKYNYINTFPSNIIASNYYDPRFLVFPVTYDYIRFYYRIIDTSTLFSAAIVNDIEYCSHDEFAISIAPIFFSKEILIIIINNTVIKSFYIGEYLLTIPIMDQIYYDNMIAKWKSSEFILTLNARNQNSQCKIDNILLNITHPKDESSISNDNPSYWWVLGLSFGIFIVLLFSVWLVYKCIFKKRITLHSRLHSLN